MCKLLYGTPILDLAQVPYNSGVPDVGIVIYVSLSYKSESLWFIFTWTHLCQASRIRNILYTSPNAFSNDCFMQDNL